MRPFSKKSLAARESRNFQCQFDFVVGNVTYGLNADAPAPRSWKHQRHQRKVASEGRRGEIEMTMWVVHYPFTWVWQAFIIVERGKSYLNLVRPVAIDTPQFYVLSVPRCHY